MKLEPPDTHHLSATEGWLGLGCPEEARVECAQIRPAFQSHPKVLRARCEIHSAAKEWELCCRLARELIERQPRHVSGWIKRSYSLHEMKRTQEAYHLLLEAVPRFPRCSTIPYNLACYSSQLGDQSAALRWLAQALKLGDQKEIKATALADPDLAPCRDAIGQL